MDSRAGMNPANQFFLAMRLLHDGKSSSMRRQSHILHFGLLLNWSITIV